MRTPLRLVVAFLAAAVAVPGAQIPQGVFTEAFPPAEFAARRQAVMAAIGDAIAIIQGAVERSAELPFRQSAQFYYLTGVEVPRAILVIDGRAKTSTLYIEPAGFRVRALGPSLTAGPEAAKVTGLDAVMARDQFLATVQAMGKHGRKVFVAAGSDVVGGGSRAEANGLETATKRDPWDGRPTRYEAFLAQLKQAMGKPDLAVENLDPIVDRLRVVKSAREIAVIREATRIAGLGIMEAMREAEPGVYEYELQAVAEYVFKKHGAQGPAYFALVAAGPNMVYSHYHKGTRRLVDGELVQFDYAPDFQYYVSDVTRVFPANGTFTSKQREFYAIYLAMYRALMSEIRPGVPVRELLQAAGKKMQAAIDATSFTSEAIKTAAQQFADRYKNSQGSSFGHAIGLEVHDVGRGRPADGTPVMLEPGQLFTIEPALQVPAEGLAMRLEDALLVTATGYENLSAFVPLEIPAIEQLMTEPGITALLKKRNGQAASLPTQSAWVLPAATTPYVGTASGVVTDAAGATLTITNPPAVSSSSAAGRASATLPAESFRGRRVSLRGELQTRGCAGCSATLWMRLDKPDGILFADMGLDRAVRTDGDWTPFSVTLPVPKPATTLAVGLMFQGGGAVTARGVRLDLGAPVSLDAPVAQAAQAEIDAAIGHVRKNAWMRHNIDWTQMNEDLRFLTAGAEQPSDVYLAIRYLLAALKDRHSFLLAPAATKAFQTGGADNPPIAVRALGDRIGYVDVPAYAGGDAAAARAFATRTHESLAATAGDAACGWVVDLRNNGGGNMWPMLAGLKPFLGDESLGTFVSREGPSPPWKAGQSVNVEPPASLRTLAQAWVAVLTGPLTASSGEAVTISFKGRPRTRSFGHPTTGLSSGNGNFSLPDGAMMFLTTVIEADRTGRHYGEKVDPDEVVAGEPLTGTARGKADDATMAAATNWLKQACKR